ncbi:MAG TPA: transporter [Thermoanaerobaculia bacterium]|nr:transporter [Thermoanaerobaculia bacterium]
MVSKTLRRIFVVAAAAVLLSRAASGQQLIIKGMYGMYAGTQAPPGLYVGMFGNVNWQDEIKGPNGNAVKGPSLTQEIFGPLIQWVSPYKILGGNYSAVVAIPFANFALDFPRLDNQGASTGLALSQLYVSPFQLGWHSDKPMPIFNGGTDVLFAYTFYAPTGRYTPGALDNTSFGMWCNEISLRATGFIGKEKEWSAAGALFYDINSKKQDVDWKQGNAINYMWGVGHTFGEKQTLMSGWFGVAGYAQWQVSSTTGVEVPEILQNNKSTVYGVGPELTALQGALTVRYFWQYGAKTSTQGRGLYVQFAMPLGK